MAPSTETVVDSSSLSKPSYISVFIHVLEFFCGALLPGICTNTTRSLAVLALFPLGIVTFVVAIRMPTRRPEGQTLFYSSYATGSLIALLSVATIVFLMSIHRMTLMHMNNRKEANPSARKIVEERIKSKRLIREEKYDIYLPKNNIKGKPYPMAFFILPGALVEHNVYAPWLARLSDNGILVIMQNCEPFRVAAENFMSSEQHIKDIIQQIQRQGITADRWSIGGHSMGGYTAMMIAKKSDYFDSLVMYGVNKNYELEKTNIRALSITASRDGLAHSKMADLSSYEAWKQPIVQGRLFHKIIEGGNHSGFGDYPRQTFPLPDGERTISLEQQHSQIVKHTVAFLMPKQD